MPLTWLKVMNELDEIKGERFVTRAKFDSIAEKHGVEGDVTGLLALLSELGDVVSLKAKDGEDYLVVLVRCSP